MSEINASTLMHSCVECRFCSSSGRSMIIHNRTTHHGLIKMTKNLCLLYTEIHIYDTNTTNFKCFNCDLIFQSWNEILVHSETTGHKALNEAYVFDKNNVAIIISPSFDKRITRFLSWDSYDCSLFLFRCPICDETVVSLQEYHNHVSSTPNCRKSIIDTLKVNGDFRNIRPPQGKSQTSITSSAVIINDINRGVDNNLIATNISSNHQFICLDCKESFDIWERCEKHIRDDNHMKGNIDSSGRELRFQLKSDNKIHYQCPHCSYLSNKWKSCLSHLKEKENSHGYFNNINEVKRACSSMINFSSLDRASSCSQLQPSPNNNTTTTRFLPSTPIRYTSSKSKDNDATNNNITRNKKIASPISHAVEDSFAMKYISDDEDDEERIYYCPDCKKQYEHWEECYSHINTKNHVAIYLNTSNRNMEFLSHPGRELLGYQCHHCQEYFKKWKECKHHLLTVEKQLGYFDNKKILKQLCVSYIFPDDLSPSMPISLSTSSYTEVVVPVSVFSLLSNDTIVTNHSNTLSSSIPQLNEEDMNDDVLSIPLVPHKDIETYFIASSSNNNSSGSSGSSRNGSSSSGSDSSIPKTTTMDLHKSIVTVNSSLQSNRKFLENNSTNNSDILLLDVSNDMTSYLSASVAPISIFKISPDGTVIPTELLTNQNIDENEVKLKTMNDTTVTTPSPQKRDMYNINDSINPNLIISNYPNNIKDTTQENEFHSALDLQNKAIKI